LPIADGSLLLGYVTLQRLVELAIARRNTSRLLARGAYEAGAGHYPVMVALHAAWLVTLWGFGWNHPLDPAFVLVFAVLQVGRFWVLRTLGERWTTRIIMAPWMRPITAGPFRFVRHPNYLVVALELPCASLALGLPWHALVFGVLNLLMLAWRIRAEDAAFALVARGAPPDQQGQVGWNVVLRAFRSMR
jgi:methyltransferase